MEKFKKFLWALLFPPMPVVLMLAPVAAVLLIYAFVASGAHPIIVYGSYGLSFYALTILCAGMPRILKSIRKFRQENRFMIRYESDLRFRANVSLLSSLVINLAYAVFQLCLGIYHGSVWFYAFAVYYALLGAMRYFLSKQTRRKAPGEDYFLELLLYRFCGILLVVMNLALGVIVFYIVHQGRTFRHHEITTISMAAYTFTSMTLAIINVIQYRKYHSPALSASKAISLAAASVSMLTLETAMLTTFGGQQDLRFRQTMTACTGAAVCILVLSMAVYMIHHSTKEIKARRNAQ